ncbi:MAG: glycosyltransferase [Nitrospirae bacterium]|nr:glycosyltransferase [Nitrospirota bacterium]
MPNASGIRLSIIVAVYSETSSLVETVERMLRNDRGYIHEIIIVAFPRSSKECFDVCEGLIRKYDKVKLHIQQKTPGIGWAFREGMKMAGGTHVAIMSGDLETEPEAIDRMVRKIEETDCDVVIGNRWLKGGGFHNYDRLKLVLNWIFQLIFKTLFLTRIGDLTYGFKILKKDVIDSINWEGTQHEICIETTLKPMRRGYRIEQVPTVWIGRIEGESKNPLLRNFRYVGMAFRILFSGAKA